VPLAYTGTTIAHHETIEGVGAHEIGVVYWQDRRHAA
jgi:hypothetical protein